MAADTIPFTRSTNQYQWIELLSKVQELAEATATENAQLGNRVKELEVELSVWKRAHSAAERENKVRDDQLLVFKLQGSGSFGPSSDENDLVLCVIDGTRTFFAASYITQGEGGGLRAYQEIIRGINQYFTDDIAHEKKPTTLSISVYVNKRRLVDDLVAHDLCTANQFAAFCDGLSEASPALTIIDVASKTDADAKIKEYLQTYAKLPQTSRFFFAGGYGYDFPSIVTVAESASVDHKMVMLRSHASLSFGYIAQFPVLQLDGLFMKQIPSSAFAAARPIIESTASSVSPTVDDEMSQIMSPVPSSVTPSLKKVPVLDPTLPLYKQNPPPCNEHYLLTECSKNGRCKYSHDYVLTEEQKTTLAKNAKQSPCWFLNNDTQCPYGDACCWGHVCPFGIKCHFSSKDKCRFKGSGMHRPKGEAFAY